MGTILCMSQMWFPQEKPSNQRKVRLRPGLSSKKNPSRQRATARFSVLQKREGTLFGLMASSPCSPMPARIQLSCKNQLRRIVFSQAGPKRCQWKIDVWIRESFRRQNGRDAGPGSFELRVFLRGLRQKQH